MTVDQVAHFCAEMRSKNAFIGRIRLLGGEASLHPKLGEIIRLLYYELVKNGHSHEIWIVTNGTGPDKIAAARTKDLAKELDDSTPEIPVIVRVSDEAEKQQIHIANMARTPASLGYEGTICCSPFYCGFSLNYYGYFPCSAGAGIARLQDSMLKWQRLALPLSVTKPCNAVLDTWPDLRQLCDHCYQGLRESDKIKCGTGQQPEQFALNTPHESVWQHLAPWLAGKQPDWKIYGHQV